MTNCFTESHVWGWDTETNDGPPITLQLYTEDLGKRSEVFFVNRDNVFKRFIAYLDRLPSKTIHTMYAHNLKFDIPSLMWPFHRQLINRNGFDFTYGNWRITGVHGAPSYAKMWNESRGVQVYLLDSFLWFQTSLEKAGELVAPHLPKLKAPKGLGTKRFTSSDKAFVRYAIRDAEVGYHLGKVVQSFHREFDISQSLTLAHMASKIFRKHFLRHTLEQPSLAIMKASQASYHGGKNNVLPGSYPAWHSNVAALDISSAYPYAMSQLPSFAHHAAYRRDRNKGSKRRIQQVHRFGVYRISGVAADCHYPSLFDHSFTPLRGRFSDVWVNSFDLNAALSHGEVSLRSIEGWYYDEQKDKRASPFAAFVNTFYSKKESATDPIQRYMYKTVLNSLYGKFIQTTQKEDEVTGEKVYVAGGMYHPFIASAITAHTRHYIHDIEHEFSAIHTATDGVFAPNHKKLERQLASFNKERGNSGGLGSLKFEALGDLLLLRNKLYVLYGEKGFASKHFRNKTITKHALHGFQSSVYDLERLIAFNKRKYQTNRPNQLRESLKSDKTPNQFVTRDMVLKVGPVRIST